MRSVGSNPQNATVCHYTMRARSVLKRAGCALAEAIKPAVVKWWEAGAIPAQMLSDNEIAMATAWKGRIAAIQEPLRPEEAYTIQREQWEGGCAGLVAVIGRSSVCTIFAARRCRIGARIP